MDTGINCCWYKICFDRIIKLNKTLYWTLNIYQERFETNSTWGSMFYFAFCWNSSNIADTVTDTSYLTILHVDTHSIDVWYIYLHILPTFYIKINHVQVNIPKSENWTLLNQTSLDQIGMAAKPTDHVTLEKKHPDWSAPTGKLGLQGFPISQCLTSRIQLEYLH